MPNADVQGRGQRSAAMPGCGSLAPSSKSLSKLRPSLPISIAISPEVKSGFAAPTRPRVCRLFLNHHQGRKARLATGRCGEIGRAGRHLFAVSAPASSPHQANASTIAASACAVVIESATRAVRAPRSATAQRLIRDFNPYRHASWRTLSVGGRISLCRPAERDHLKRPRWPANRRINAPWWYL